MLDRHSPPLFAPLCAALLLTVAPCLRPAFAQVDAGFAPNPDDTIHAIAVQADGRIVVGGRFVHIDGSSRNGIARLNADGSLDDGFDPNAGYTDERNIYRIVMQPDGKLLVGGDFPALGAVPGYRIGRLNPNGSVDAGFAATVFSHGDDTVYDLAVQPDGKVLVAGKLSTLFETPFGAQWVPMGVVRLNPDGSRDESYRPAVTNDTFIDGEIFALALQASGKLVIAGSFTRIDGQSRKYLARLNADGSLDTGFSADVEGSWVSELAVQPNDKILLGGAFLYIGGVRRNNLARLNTDGSVDTGFDPFPDLDVHGLALQANGRILVGGNFTHIGGKARNRIARLDPDGRVDAGFDFDANGRVGHIAVQTDRRILVASGDLFVSGPGFTAIDALPRNGFARLDAGDDVIFGNGFD